MKGGFRMDNGEIPVQNYGTINNVFFPLDGEGALATHSRCGRFCSERFCNALRAAAVTFAVEILAGAIFASQLILPELYKRGIPIDYKLGLAIGIPLTIAIAAIVGGCAYCHPGITELERAS